jgi:hypothetical protein
MPPNEIDKFADGTNPDPSTITRVPPSTEAEEGYIVVKCGSRNSKIEDESE